eukprot:tig00021037_g17431.t1
MAHERAPPLRIVVAPNAFKESISAPAAAKAIARGVPLADGGDGTMEALVAARGGRFVPADACDPLLRSLQTRYGVVEDGGESTAVIEMAQSSGLFLLKPSERDPLRTSTYGTGLVVRAALEAGCRRILLTIGGSATTDAGIGLAAALGYRFLDEAGKEIDRPVGADMARASRIDPSGVHPLLKESRIVVACDVQNPLLGPRGAAAVFGPQKGARVPEGVRELEAGLARIAGLWERDLGVPPGVKEAPGAGAAGGLGAGLVALFGAELKPGFELVAGLAGLDAALRGAALVLTAEGRPAPPRPAPPRTHARPPPPHLARARARTRRIDASTALGKVRARGGGAAGAGGGGGPRGGAGGGVAAPEELEPLYEAGLAAAVSIAGGPATLAECVAGAPRLLEAAAFQVARIHRASASASASRGPEACPSCGRPATLTPQPL